MSIKRYSAAYCEIEHEEEYAGEYPVEPMADDDGDFVRYADHLAALEAERKRGEVRWLFTDKSGVESIFRYPVFFVGGTAHRVRVVEEDTEVVP